MKQVIEITRNQRDSMIGAMINSTNYFNPVLNDKGKWCISKRSVEMITNPDFIDLKQELLVEYKNISEAESLADVFNSDEINDEDVDNVLNQISEHNSLVRKDIRFRGIKPSDKSKEARTKLMSEGVLILRSKAR